MRLLRCLVSLLLVFVLSFALFLTSSYAMPVPDNWEILDYEPIEVPEANSGISTFALNNDTEYKIKYQVYARSFRDYQWISGSTMYTYTSNVPIEYESSAFDIRPYSWYDYRIAENISFYRSDDSIMGSEGMSLKLHIKDFKILTQHGSNYSTSTESFFNVNAADYCFLVLYDSKGNTHYQQVNGTDIIIPTDNPKLFDLIIDIDSVPCDVKKIEFEFTYHPQSAFDGLNPNTEAYIMRSNTFLDSDSVDGTTVIDMFFRTDTGGLLGNIIKIVTNIKDGITDLGSTVSSGLSNVVSSITQLPSKIWSFFEDGLKGLFIPTEEQMTEVKADWDNLLSDRFGGLYQSVQLIDDYASSFTNTESKNTIKVPELSVDLVGSTFTFGGQDVQIIPDKFSFLIDVIKTIISIIATTFFVNGLRNRFTREVIEGGTEQ